MVLVINFSDKKGVTFVKHDKSLYFVSKDPKDKTT